MAKLMTIKGRKKPMPKRKTNAVGSWGRNCKDETCFSPCETRIGYIVVSPLNTMSLTEGNSFVYIVEEFFHLDFTKFIEELAVKYNAEIKENSKFKYLIYKTEQDARNCKNYLNKMLREM